MATPAYPPPGGKLPGGGQVAGGGIGGGQLGGVFGTLSSRAPGAAIQPPAVPDPSRGDFGAPGTAPQIGTPSKGDYGLDPMDKAAAQGGLRNAADAAASAERGFNQPTKTGAFANLMNLSGEVTGAQAQEQQRHAADASQRRGYAGGFEDTARQSSIDRMNALATAGFQGAQTIQQEEGAQYGRAIGAFAQMQDSYDQAEATGNTAFAHDLTSTHIAQAEDALKTMDLNQTQQLAFANATQQARQLQAQLKEQFNKDLIDNSRFIQGNAQIAAGLQASMAALQEKSKEFEETRSDTERNQERALTAEGRSGTGATFASQKSGLGGTFQGLA